MNHSLRWLIQIQFLLIASFSFAQTDFKPGYIVRNEGDTVHGQIDYRGALLMGISCTFRHSNDEIELFSPGEISAFRFNDSKYYISYQVNEEMVFLEYLIKGQVNIFYRRDKFGDHYYMQKEDLPFTEIPYEEGIRYVDNKERYYESKKHIGLLQYYMKDAPELRTRITHLKKPEHHYMIKLARDYHNMVCPDVECTIYSRKTPALKINPEIMGGMFYLNRKLYAEDGEGSFAVYGGILHVWLPLTSEKLFFRTGMILTNLEISRDGGQQQWLKKVPIQLEYIFPRGVIRPRIAGGCNLYFPIASPVAINAGVNVKSINPYSFRSLLMWNLPVGPTNRYFLHYSSVTPLTWEYLLNFEPRIEFENFYNSNHAAS